MVIPFTIAPQNDSEMFMGVKVFTATQSKNNFGCYIFFGNTVDISSNLKNTRFYHHLRQVNSLISNGNKTNCADVGVLGF